MTYTAVRTYNRTGTKATVTVYLDGEKIGQAGGARAARAEAVILAAWGDEALGIFGLRGDFLKAQTEAHREAHQTEVKSRNRYTGRTFTIARTPAREALAVLVTEPMARPTGPAPSTPGGSEVWGG